MTQIEVNDTLGLPMVVFGFEGTTIHAYLITSCGGTDEYGDIDLYAHRIISDKLPLLKSDLVERVADAIEEEFDKGILKHSYWQGIAWRGWQNFECRFDVVVQERPPG